MYNLPARGMEQEHAAMAREFGVSIVVYNPLAAGLLTGKYRRDAVPPSSRFGVQPVIDCLFVRSSSDRR